MGIIWETIRNRFLRLKPAQRPGSVLSPLSVEYDSAKTWFTEKQGTYEDIAQYLLSRLNRNGVIVDVGANIGHFSMCIMKQLRFKGKCHLFEPVPNLVKLARQTFANSEFNVEIHPFGLSDEAAQVTISVAADGNLGWNTMVTEKASVDMPQITIEVKRFDKLNIGDVDFIKIDTEGAEYKVLKGMIPALKGMRRLPLMMVEVGWGKDSHPYWDQELEVFRQYKALGYRFERIDGNNIDIENISGTQDVFLVPPGKVAI